MAIKHDPPTSEKTYDDDPGMKLKVAQGVVKPGKTDSMDKVKSAAMGSFDEPHHESAPQVMKNAAKTLMGHSAAGIRKVV